jgi:hypothetical protein
VLCQEGSDFFCGQFLLWEQLWEVVGIGPLLGPSKGISPCGCWDCLSSPLGLVFRCALFVHERDFLYEQTAFLFEGGEGGLEMRFGMVVGLRLLWIGVGWLWCFSHDAAPFDFTVGLNFIISTQRCTKDA